MSDDDLPAAARQLLASAGEALPGERVLAAGIVQPRAGRFGAGGRLLSAVAHRRPAGGRPPGDLILAVTPTHLHLLAGGDNRHRHTSVSSFDRSRCRVILEQRRSTYGMTIVDTSGELVALETRRLGEHAWVRHLLGVLVAA